MLAAFQRQVTTIADQVRQIENTSFRKALYVSMLDGLSACAYPNETRSGHRFRTFVLNFGTWRDSVRIPRDADQRSELMSITIPK